MAIVVGGGLVAANVEFDLDLSSRQVWDRRVARPTETIMYSSEWVPPVVPSISVGTDVLANGGFESCTISANSGSYGYNRDGQATLVAWAGNERVGMTIGNNTWTSGTGLPKGGKAAYLQRAGSIWQDFMVPEAGIYKLSFYSAARPSYVGHYMSVAIDDGADVLSFTSDKATTQLRSTTVELTKGAHRLKFTGTDASQDQSTIIDDVSLVYQAPLPVITPINRHAVVKVYPCLKEKPTYIAIDLSGGTNATHYPIEYLDEIPGGSWSDEYKTSKLVLRHIPVGSFIMGGRNTDYPGAVNTNLHMVTLTRDFYMGVFEVTQRQWELVMGTRPSVFSNETCYATRPVESISWNTVRGTDGRDLWPFSTSVGETTFIGRLRLKTQLSGWDAPTCSQWEYACRAGTTTSLNSGKNLSSFKECPELHDVSRNCFNSGWTEKQHVWSTYFSLGDTSRGTAKVGSYEPNRWGLYDMHGNVWEKCLDHRLDANAAVDPVGFDRSQEYDSQVIKGGSFEQSDNVLSYCSGYWQNLELSTLVGNRNVGFPLCLQGGELPDLEHPEILVDTMAAGCCTWSPMTSGTRYLTHSTMNGATNEQLLSAWFEVGGPHLSLSANGELVPGVGVTVGGNEPGWTVYYTTDGTEPTTNSTAYAGAITLNETTTVRAVAYNAQGVRSEEASATFTLHDALGIASAVATPRFPWNGKVDVDVELKGNSELKYLVEVEARDLVGGTNLPVRTVGRAGSMNPPDGDGDGGFIETALPFVLPPGSYRLVWDAAADIAGDFDFNRVAVTVKATGSHLLTYPKTLELTVNGYTGTETLTNVPTLVRLSTAIPGFSYSGFATTNGSDLAFFTEDGRSLPYEIDEWNTNGESLVWVRLPALANGTRFTAAWGNSELSTLNSQLAPHEVWREYAGVWHMNEPSGTAFDSTEHHLDGIPSRGTNALADVSQMVAYADGACGRARVNGLLSGKGGNYLAIPAAPVWSLGGEFVAEGWFRLENFVQIPGETSPEDPRLISLKPESPNQKTGFELHFENGVDRLCAKAQTNSYVIATVPSALANWINVVANFVDTNVCLYANGTFVTNAVIKPVIDNPGSMLAFGNNANGSIWSLNGQYDEIRLRGGSLSADRIKADYDMIANRAFLSYGAVRTGSEAVK